ncbi:MAG: hypothetical protein LBH68_08935, partial [Bifidobacteriaceae bacterium]|nr:hypothetical protein [Bifidobacteriaceae bacterium]
HGSDGTVASFPYTQQVYVQVDQPTAATVEFCLSPGSVPLRPRRAGTNEAVLGLLGRPLIPGVNGLYDVAQDLLVDFHGADWRWDQTEVTERDGRAFASITVQLSQRPLYINLRLHYYRDHLGFPRFEPWNRRPDQRAVAGWCSWEAYRRGIDHQKVSDAAKRLARDLGPWGLRIIQVDDGFQEMPLPVRADASLAEAWTDCRPDAFPEGHAGIVAAIREAGLTPGIWLNANITNPAFPAAQPDAVLWDGDAPLEGEWIDFVCSCTPETLARHVETAFAALRSEGYGYVKVDAIRHLLFDGLHEAVRRGLLTDAEAEDRFSAYMRAARRGLGEDTYLLASWGVMSEVVGAADACRIAMDANPTWAGVRMQLVETARWWHTHRIVFTNDPDHICARTDPAWARSALSLVALSGGLLMLSDPPEAYTGEILRTIRACLPPLETRTGETGQLRLDVPFYTWTKLHGFAVQSDERPVRPEPVGAEEAAAIAGVYPSMDDAHPFATLWGFHLAAAGQRWCVAARFATGPLAAADVPITALGLDDAVRYHAFDFWERAYVGQVGAGRPWPARELPLGHCQVVALRPVTSHPQLIGSTRHVSMDAVSLRHQSWNGRTLSLRLATIPGVCDTYYVHPNGWYLVEGDAAGASLEVTSQGEVLAVSVTATAPAAVVSLVFARRDDVDDVS